MEDITTGKPKHSLVLTINFDYSTCQNAKNTKNKISLREMIETKQIQKHDEVQVLLFPKNRTPPQTKIRALGCAIFHYEQSGTWASTS